MLIEHNNMKLRGKNHKKPTAKQMAECQALFRLLDVNGDGEIDFDEFIVPDWLMGSEPDARKEHLDRLHTEVIIQL